MMPKRLPVPRSHLISDIDECNRLVNQAACHHGDDIKLLRVLNEQLRQLQVKAATEFGIMNGWRLADGGLYQCGSSTIFDHVLRFRKGHKFCASIAQPYSKDFTLICRAQRAAIANGKVCHVPPCPWSSFHFPRWTLFLVFTAIDHDEIQWLPEQVRGLAWSTAL
jgi:hypothetical protein